MPTPNWYDEIGRCMLSGKMQVDQKKTVIAMAATGACTAIEIASIDWAQQKSLHLNSRCGGALIIPEPVRYAQPRRRYSGCLLLQIFSSHLLPHILSDPISRHHNHSTGLTHNFVFKEGKKKVTAILAFSNPVSNTYYTNSLH